MSIRPQQMEMFTASQAAERLGENDRLLDMILDRRNMFSALKQVRANKGAPAIDKISVKQIGGYLKRHWHKIKAALLNGYYKPLPARRKEIDTPDGGIRLLGIPTVLDRIIQQAMTCGNARKKYWRMSRVKWVVFALSEHYFIRKGLYLPGNEPS